VTTSEASRNEHVWSEFKSPSAHIYRFEKVPAASLLSITWGLELADIHTHVKQVQQPLTLAHQVVLRDPVHLAVILERHPPEREVQFARIDTTHGYTHFDRLYRRDEPKERLDVDVWGAAALLEENGRTYAESFEKRGQQ